MKVLRFTNQAEVRASLVVAAEVASAGGVILVPTESYYGLAGDPCSTAAVARVNVLKGRPDDLGLPVVCSDWDQVDSLVEIPARFRVKLGRIWPAGLSAIARCRRKAPAARHGSLAVRIPDHEHLRALLYRTGPLTATSANRHGQPPCVTVAAALDSLAGDPDLVLDAGTLPGGKVSTMVDLGTEEGRVIRRGAVGWEQSFDPEEWLVRE